MAKEQSRIEVQGNQGLDFPGIARPAKVGGAKRGLHISERTRHFVPQCLNSSVPNLSRSRQLEIIVYIFLFNAAKGYLY